MKKIAVYASGGDSPGMNACIRAAVRTGIYHHIEMYGIIRGYEGMIAGEIIPMDSRSVANIIQRGGTILKTSRSEAFLTKEGRAAAFQQLQKHGIEGLVCIGGDGSYKGAMALTEEYGIPVIGAPGTIDNDLWGTDYTIGFDTAINTALDAIDRIRDTADSHSRTFFIEVMGRHAGDIALAVGIGGGAEAILLPESRDEITYLKSYFSNKKSGKSFSIIVVAEGDEEGGALKLAERLKKEIPGFDPRISILGHIQRGGKPSAFDRLLATRLGAACVEALLEGRTGLAAGLQNNSISFVSLKDAATKKKTLDAETVRLIEKLNA